MNTGFAHCSGRYLNNKGEIIIERQYICCNHLLYDGILLNFGSHQRLNQGKYFFNVKELSGNYHIR